MLASTSPLTYSSSFNRGTEPAHGGDLDAPRFLERRGVEEPQRVGAVAHDQVGAVVRQTPALTHDR